jgi:phosphomannomutase
VSSGELNFQIENKQKAMQTLTDHFSTEEEPLEIMDFDGYRLEFRHWWFNVRPSNTEPYLRVILEADSQELLEEKTNDIRSILNRIQ